MTGCKTLETMSRADMHAQLSRKLGGWRNRRPRAEIRHRPGFGCLNLPAPRRTPLPMNGGFMQPIHDFTSYVTIGRRLRLARINRGSSIHDLCDAMGDGCCCEELEAYEAGQGHLTVVVLIQLATILDVPIEFLLCEASLLDCSGEWQMLQLYRSLPAKQQTRITKLLLDIVADVAVG